MSFVSQSIFLSVGRRHQGNFQADPRHLGRLGSDVIMLLGSLRSAAVSMGGSQIDKIMTIGLILDPSCTVLYCLQSKTVVLHCVAGATGCKT